MQHEFTARPWSKVNVDLCYENGCNLLVMCDYCSNFIEVAQLKSTTSCSMIREMKEVFAQFGVPDVLVSDNALQFASAEFAVFATMLAFKHVTSSPHYPVKRESRKRSENDEETVHQMS